MSLNKKPLRSFLESEMVLIRPFEEQDLADFFRAVRESVHSLTRWLPWCRPDYSMEDAKEWFNRCAKHWEKGDAYPFGIFEKKSGLILGGVALNKINSENNSTELGYWVRGNRRGEGVALAAAELAVKFAFHDLGLRRIEFLVLPENKASQRVIEKLGGREEGTLKDRLVIHGKSRDALLYSISP